MPPPSVVLKARYPRAPDRILLLSLIGLLWDRAEPSGYMRACPPPLVWLARARPRARSLTPKSVFCIFPPLPGGCRRDSCAVADARR